MMTLCKHYSDRYHFNILRIIAIKYHIYIGIELYNLVYVYSQSCVHEQELLNLTMSKCQYHDSLTRYVIF